MVNCRMNICGIKIIILKKRVKSSKNITPLLGTTNYLRRRPKKAILATLATVKVKIIVL